MFSRWIFLDRSSRHCTSQGRQILRWDGVGFIFMWIKFYKYSQTGPYVGHICCSLAKKHISIAIKWENGKLYIYLYIATFVYISWPRGRHTQTPVLWIGFGHSVAGFRNGSNCGLRIGADEILKKPKQHHKCTPQTQLTDARQKIEIKTNFHLRDFGLFSDSDLLASRERRTTHI